MKQLIIEWDEESPAVYVTFGEMTKPGQVTRTEEIDELVMADFDTDGKLLGLEMIGSEANLFMSAVMANLRKSVDSNFDLVKAIGYSSSKINDLASDL